MFIVMLSLANLILFTYLLMNGHIGQASYCFLATLIPFVGIVLKLYPSLSELDFKNLKLTLKEIKETKADLFAKQDDLKNTALIMSEILALSNSAQGRLDSSEGYKIKRQWYEYKLNELINKFDFNDQQVKEIKKYSDKFKEIDRLLMDRDSLKTSDPDYKEVKSKLEQLSSEIGAMQQKDITNQSS